MLKIRLQRVGRKHEPTFRVVVTESQNSTKSGRSLEVLGSYDSRRGDKAEIKADRVKYWMSQGAQVSGTMHNLLIEKKIITGKKVNVLGKKKPIVKEVPKEETKAGPATAPVGETPKTEAPKAEAPKAEEVKPAEAPKL